MKFLCRKRSIGVVPTKREFCTLRIISLLTEKWITHILILILHF